MRIAILWFIIYHVYEIPFGNLTQNKLKCQRWSMNTYIYLLIYPQNQPFMSTNIYQFVPWIRPGIGKNNEKQIQPNSPRLQLALHLLQAQQFAPVGSFGCLEVVVLTLGFLRHLGA